MNGEKVPERFLWRAMAAVMLAGAFHTQPRGIAYAASTAAPWAIMAAGAVAFLLAAPVAAALARRPGAGLVQLAVDAGGRPLAVIFALVMTPYVIAAGSMTLRQIAEMTITSAYPHTPQTFLISALLLAAIISSLMAPQDAMWFSYVWSVPYVLAILAITIGGFAWGKLAYLVPPTGPGLVNVGVNSLPMTSYFGELYYLFVLSGYLSSPHRLLPAIAKTLALTSVMWALVMLGYLMTFPLPAGLSVPFPMYELTQLLMFGRFLERMDAFWMLFWAMGGAGGISAGIIATSQIYRETFRLPNHRLAILPLAVAILAASLFPSNQVTAVHSSLFLIRRWGFLITLVVPLLVAIAATVRGRARHV